MQVILLATVALAVASLASIAVPKLSGDLIDVCISFGQGKYDSDAAKHKLNGSSTLVNCLQAFVPSRRFWPAPLLEDGIGLQACCTRF